eukprot:Gb_10208 [translate_table: standard]
MYRGLYMTALCGCDDCVKCLHDDDKTRRDIVCQVTPQGNTALHLAARAGHHQYVSKLLKLKTCILFARNFKQETALHAAARWGHTQVVEDLLKINENNVVCTCESHVLSSELDSEEYPVDRQFWSAQTTSGNTALHYAAKGGHRDFIQILLSKDEDLALLVNKAGESALFTACEEGHITIVRLLLEKVSCISDKRHDGQSSLHAAILKNHWELDRELCYTVNGKGKSAIHIAARKRYIKIMDALVESNPDCIELLDKDGKTFLHLLLETLAEDTFFSLSSFRVLIFISYLFVQFESHFFRESDNEGNAVFHTETEDGWITRIVAQYNALVKAVDKHKPASGEELKAFYKDSSNTLILVATLLATITFAAAFTLPGGINSEGSAVLISRPSFKIFVIASTVAMFLSMGAVSFLSSPQLNIFGSATLSKAVTSGTHILSFAILATELTFIVAMYMVVAPKCLWLAITVCVIGCVIHLEVFYSSRSDEHSSWSLLPHEWVLLFHCHILLREQEPRAGNSLPYDGAIGVKK